MNVNKLIKEVFRWGVSRLNDNWNKVNTKEGLTEMLKRYSGILANPMIDYLNSLIELEFSVIREYLGEDDRKSLAELEIYKRIAIYNIYNRALNLFNENKIKFSVNEDEFSSLSISVPLNSNQNVRVFNFDYTEWNTAKIPDEYKTMRIGTISLYQSLESQELMAAELNRVMNKLERLHETYNPYPSRRGVADGPESQWAYEYAQEIAKYAEIFTKLGSKKELNHMDKIEIEITNQIRNLLLEDYGLTNKSFEEEVKPTFSWKKSTFQKTLVKRQPNLSIINHIKYI